MSTLTLLVVDDQLSVRSTLGYLLTAHGYEVLLAGSGREALALAESRIFDAALVDLHMPNLDGATVCRTLCERAHAQGRALPVWLMTAAYTTSADAHARASGARALLKKPFDCDAWVLELENQLALPPPAASEIVPLPSVAENAMLSEATG